MIYLILFFIIFSYLIKHFMIYFGQELQESIICFKFLLVFDLFFIFVM